MWIWCSLTMRDERALVLMRSSWPVVQPNPALGVIQVSTTFRAIVSLVLGLVVGVLLVSGLCSIPGLTFSSACGHNSGIWLILAVPLGIAVCWVTLSAISKHYSSARAPTPPPVVRCSRCGGDISLDDPDCPRCGFHFGT